MKELETAILSAFNDLTSSGKLKEIIDAKVAETVKSVIDSALRPYSEFGKSLTAAIERSLKIDTGKLGIPGYNEALLQIVRKKLDHEINVVGKERLEKDLENLLAAGAPKEVSISKLVEQFKEWVREESHRDTYDEHVTFIHEKSQYGGGWFYLDPGEDVKKYDCKFRLAYSSEGEIYSATLSGKDADKSIFLGGLFGFERTLFQMYAARTRVVIDTDDPDIYQPTHD